MGIKVHPPTGPSHFTSFSPNEVCFYRLAGRCNRCPCKFLHSELPNSHAATTVVASATTKRAIHRSLTWRNPNTAGRNGQDGQVAAEDPARPHMDKICCKFMAGSCSLGEKCKFLHSWFIGDGSFSLLATLHGHQKLLKESYCRCQDEMARVWDCHTG